MRPSWPGLSREPCARTAVSTSAKFYRFHIVFCSRSPHDHKIQDRFLKIVEELIGAQAFYFKQDQACFSFHNDLVFWRDFSLHEAQAASNGEPMTRQIRQIEPNSTDHRSNEKW
jgi:hypothetical protein